MQGESKKTANKSANFIILENERYQAEEDERLGITPEYIYSFDENI
jgi:hypothetical protein